MAKRVIGNYQTEAAALEKTNELLAEGYLKDSITLAANSKMAQSIRSQTNVEILIQPSESKNEESLGDKLKAVFSLDSESSSTIPNEEILDNYRNALAQGEIVILVEDDTTEIYPTDPDLALENDPSDLARGEKQTRSTRTQHLDYEDENLDPGINTDGDLEIEEDFPPTDAPDRSDFYQ